MRQACEPRGFSKFGGVNPALRLLDQLGNMTGASRHSKGEDNNIQRPIMAIVIVEATDAPHSQLNGSVQERERQTSAQP